MALFGQAARQTATSGSNDWLPANQSANFFSGAYALEKRPVFPGTFLPESSPEQRQKLLPIPAIRAFSTDFLRAVIVEWSFGMHID